MAFPADDIFLGPRAYGMRKGSEGVVYHTTEGGGPSRSAAIATAKEQSFGGSLYAGGGSYNFIVYDGGALLTVPYMESSGSLTLKRTNPPWNPAAWLKDLLSPAAFSDPNAYLMSIAFSGKAVDLAAGRYPGNMIDTAARLLLWFEQQPWGKDNATVMGHSDWQSDRSDPGAGVIDRILKRYGEITSPLPAPDYAALYAAEKARADALQAKLVNVLAAVEETDSGLARAFAILRS